MKRVVNYVKFHQGLFIPGIGTLADTLPSSSKTLDLVMMADNTGIDLNIKYLGRTIEAFIPWTNVVLATFAPEDKPPTGAKLKAA